MREDDFTNTEADAATHAAILGRSEWVGGDAGDQEPNPLLDGGDARLRPDPWLPWTCPKCGSEDRVGCPETCAMCGYRNYGEAS